MLAMSATFIARGRRVNGRERDTSAAKHAGRPDQRNNLPERWQAARNKLSDGRRRLVDGILEHLDETVFLTFTLAITDSDSTPLARPAERSLLALLKPTEAEYRDGLRWYREPAQRRRDRASGGAVRKRDRQQDSRSSGWRRSPIVR